MIEKIFVFSFMWTLGGALECDSQHKFEIYMSNEFTMNIDAKVSIYENKIVFDRPGAKWEFWSADLKEFEFNSKASYFDQFVPTKDTIRYDYLLSA